MHYQADVCDHLSIHLCQYGPASAEQTRDVFFRCVFTIIPQCIIYRGGFKALLSFVALKKAQNDFK